MDKIICVGKNYLKHAQELGGELNEEPLYFFKPPSVLLVVEGGETKLDLPKNAEIHYELELVLKISEVDDRLAFTHYTFGLDLTNRELQTRLKKAGQPWEKAKVFKNSAIIGSWTPIYIMKDVLDLTFELEVNGQVKQKGQGRDMRWSPETLLKDVQKWFPLESGDIMFTGTPEGVGPIHSGDELNISGGPVTFRLKVN